MDIKRRHGETGEGLLVCTGTAQEFQLLGNLVHIVTDTGLDPARDPIRHQAATAIEQLLISEQGEQPKLKLTVEFSDNIDPLPGKPGVKVAETLMHAIGIGRDIVERTDSPEAQAVWPRIYKLALDWRVE